MGIATQTDRLDVRLPTESKTLIARAAELLGLNLSAFTVATLVERAREVVDKHAVIELSNRDRDRFLFLLDNPPSPSDALKRAAQEHKESVDSR